MSISTKSARFARQSRRSVRVKASSSFRYCVRSAAGSTAKTHATVETITVNLIPIANTLPLDIGIQKGFFQQQGIEIKKNVLQSGNDVVLALANKTGEVGFAELGNLEQEPGRRRAEEKERRRLRAREGVQRLGSGRVQQERAGDGEQRGEQEIGLGERHGRGSKPPPGAMAKGKVCGDG